MSDSSYDTAQICLNGHVVNTSAASSPESNQKYCVLCGSETITACPDCNTTIRGDYKVHGLIIAIDYDKPAYCNSCGKPFPWTVIGLEEASKLADTFKKLSQKEKQQLKDSFPDLISDTPKTIVAVTLFNELMKKAGQGACDGMKQILFCIVSEAVKKLIFG